MIYQIPQQIRKSSPRNEIQLLTDCLVGLTTRDQNKITFAILNQKAVAIFF